MLNEIYFADYSGNRFCAHEAAWHAIIARMFTLFVRIAVVAALIGVAVHWAQGAGPGAVPLVVVVFGAAAARYFARDLVDLVPALARLARRRALEPWNGRYYAFDGHQVRLYLVDGTVWIAAGDLKDILVPPPTGLELRQMPEGARVPGTNVDGYTEAALLRLLALRNANRGGRRELLRFAHWLQNEAAPNLRRLPSSTT